MFKFLKGVFGVSTEKKTIFEAAQVPKGETYAQQLVWKNAYKGYVSAWHEVYEHTIDGRVKRDRKSMRMAKVVSNRMASLVFNEKVIVSAADDDDQRFLNAVMRKNSFFTKTQQLLEKMFALGGAAIRVYVENGEIKLNYSTGDMFLPTEYNGQEVTGGVFVSQTRKGEHYFTRFERHYSEFKDGRTVYIIENELYRSESAEVVGQPYPLESVFPSMQAKVIFSTLSRPTFVYITPNVANNIEFDSVVGMSIYADALDTLETIDTFFDSLNREMKLKKPRIVVPTHFLKAQINKDTGQPQRYFDTSDEVYEAFNMGDELSQVNDVSGELRIDEIVSGLNAALRVLAMQTGFDAGAFTYDRSGLKTATEVISEDSETYQTRSGHLTIIDDRLKALFRTVYELAETFNIHKAANKDVALNFDDAIVTDTQAKATFWGGLKAQGLVPTRLALQRVLNVSEEEAKVLASEIAAEQRAGMVVEEDITNLFE